MSETPEIVAPAAPAAPATEAPAATPDAPAEAPADGGVTVGEDEGMTAAERSAALAAMGLADEPATTETAPEPPRVVDAVKLVEPTEEDAANLVRLVKEDRRIKHERAKLDAQSKEHAESVARAKAFDEAKGSGDKLAMLRALGMDDEAMSDLFVDLADKINANDAAAPLTRAQAEEIAERKFEAKLAAKAKEEAETKTTTDTKLASDAKSGYAAACAQAFQADRAAFPLVAAMGVSTERIDAVVRATFEKTGRVPGPREVLAHFESKFAAQGLMVRGQESRAAGPTVTSAWKDSGGAIPPPAPEMDLSTRLNALKALAEKLVPR